MRHRIKLNMPHIIAKGLMDANLKLANQLVGDCINYRHILVFEGNICIIRTDRHSWISDKNAMIDRVILNCIRTIRWVKLHLRQYIKWAMLTHYEDDTTSDIPNKHLAEIRSNH